MPPEFGYFLLVCSSAYGVYLAQGLPRLDSIRRWDRALGLFIVCYGFGVGFKLLEVGPELIRFYLSDWAWPGATSNVIALIGYNLMINSWRQQGLTIARIWMNVVQINRWAIPIMWALAFGYELLTGYAARLNSGPVENVGLFDWVDIAACTLGSFCALAMLQAQARLLKRYL